MPGLPTTRAREAAGACSGMSVTPIALEGPPTRRLTSAEATGEWSPARPLISLIAFAAFGLYGVLRWQTLLEPAPTSRLLELLGLASAVLAAGTLLPRFAERQRRDSLTKLPPRNTPAPGPCGSCLRLS